MIPSPWVAAVLALATFRIVRLLGWDHLPVLVRARDWVAGKQTTSRGSHAARIGVAEPVEYGVGYRRPFFDLLFGCAYCLGVWVAVPVYVAWYFEPWWTLTILAPAALSAVVGIVARWLDP